MRGEMDGDALGLPFWTQELTSTMPTCAECETISSTRAGTTDVTAEIESL